MKLTPLGDRVVIKKIEAEEKTKSGIVLPSTAKEQPQMAEVIAVGVEIDKDEKTKDQLKVGDKIIFTNRTNNEKIDVLVTNLFKADSFAPIYEKYSKVAMGYNEEDDAKPEDMEEYYSKEEIKKYGCIAIEIEKVLK